MARGPSRASPVPVALDRLARLAATGTVPDRMARETRRLIADWRAEPGLDGPTLRERLETLRDDIALGVVSAEEQAGDVDQGDKASVRQAASAVAGLRAVHAVVLDEMDAP